MLDWFFDVCISALSSDLGIVLAHLLFGSLAVLWMWWIASEVSQDDDEDENASLG